MKIKTSIYQKIFDVINNIFMLFMIVIMLYPIWHVVVGSFSDNSLLIGHTGVLLHPLGFSTNAYKLMLKNPMILKGFANTLFIVVCGVALNITFTSLGAYVLSRKDLLFRRLFMMLITFTMFFSGGLIPTYLLVSKTLGLNDTYAAIILPTLINTYNLIIMRTSFESIPASLEESASLDGANDWLILYRIIIPLSMPVIAVMILYYAVGHWNAYFNAFMYLSNPDLYPLQIFLRDILIASKVDAEMIVDDMANAPTFGIEYILKYSLIVVATVPMLIIYPFVQKHFVKGVMIGAVKG